MALLALESVSRAFGGLKAVSGVDLTAERGSITGLIGPNGAGKTTLINLITGFLAPSAGSIRFDGIDISALQPHVVARLGLARTFQNIRLLKEETVVWNVMTGFVSLESAGVWDWMFLRGAARRERAAFRSEALKLLAAFGMPQFADYPAGALSYGHQRRVEIMRAMAARPSLLLLDEPAAGMNDNEAEALGCIFRDLAKNGTAVLLVEHNMGLVMSVCDKIAVLQSGELIACGPPSGIASNPHVIDAYLGT